MRAAVGDISAAPGGADFVLRLLDECLAVAAAEGYPPRPAFLDGARRTLTAAGSPFTASMLRDIENGAPIEADHIIGDLIRRGRDLAWLPMVYTHLKAYEARRARSRL
jgi:2-dehydropantoate 2-reductase